MEFVISEDGWISGVRKVPSPNFNDRPVGEEPSLLVIHNISLPPGQFGGNAVEKFFTNKLPADQHPFFQTIAKLTVSAHFFIQRTGAIIQFVPLHKRAWHAGVSSFEGRENCNDYAIGIELEGTDVEQYSREQYEVLIALTRAIMGRYPGISSGRIVGHSDIAPGRKTDPGASFDWSYYRAQLA
ncbi:MAG: 1,6-anhydro-N-acetylmuramyl-L-alanine amidase AmpD [Pseudomonadales bacterium]|nr:1,6-anhydro-N-acetylmuramyl-L-alanine amidase AmpD [Pseudomonadales bacterium]